MVDAEALLKISMAFVGAMGFALFFNVSKNQILCASIGGLLTWIIYWLLNSTSGALFVPCVIASTFAGTYSEICARIFKVPSTVFFIISVIPLVPGRSLFYTMSYMVNQNWSECLINAQNTLLVAAGIAFGILLVTAVFQTYVFAKRKMKRLKEKLPELIKR